MHRTLSNAVAFVLVLAGARPAMPQNGIPTFGDAVEVSVVNLSVYVTRDGMPVTDLARDDFEVFENGRKVELTNFYVFQPSPQLSAAEPAGEIPPGPSVVPEADPPKSRPSQPLFVVAYVDNMNLRPHTRKMVVERLGTFVEEQLAPEDQVMVVTADYRLRIRQEFSRDRQATRKELTGLIREPAPGILEDQSMARILTEIHYRYTDDRAGDLDAARISTERVFHQERLIAQARGTFGRLTDLVGSLGQLPGRKVVIYVSDGISAASRQDFRQLLARANANQVSFYAIDGGGSRQFDTTSAAQPGNLGGFWSAGMARSRVDAREQSLIDLADGTGGKMMFARKNMDRELDGFRDAVAHYYSLGFSPRAQGPEIRRIKVKVRRKGVDVRFPKSYRLKTSQEKLYERVLSALRLGVADNELDLDVDVGAATRQKGSVVMPILVRVPVDRLVLIPDRGADVGSVTVMYGVLDSEGRSSEVHLGNLPISVPENRRAELAGQTVGYEVMVAMAPGSRRLAVAARDDVGRTMAAIQRELELEDG